MVVSWVELAAGFALAMVLEGVLPFLSPRRFRDSLIRVAAMSDRALRGVGFLCMLAGLLTLYWVR